ncbi:hydrogenase formation protein HypD [Novosphingobium naphthalenivorans]|uniref:hydrogenase formation protein HypD n=1 Tax=Novosphingobium naphthalenivorans TaxID=273168 RepID=UPI000829F94B|nr:hydrogenase formation protein HypD [Novosphingobium naphthalenivorans]
MKHLDEYRDPAAARRYADGIAAIVTRPWTIMEICGGQTHSIVRHGIDHMLPEGVTLLHGPGCPVCVTPPGMIDAAIAIASRPDVIFCSFGDMLRVPGNDRSLLAAKARGADVRMVYSPLDAVQIAQDNPGREVVFFAIGFETTAPATAMTVLQAESRGVANFSLLVSHVLVPPAMDALLGDPANGVQGFLAAGHVCTITGYRDYEPIARRYSIPIVVTGFEPLDLLQGLYMVIRQLEEGRCEVENQYNRSVRPDGNPAAREAMERVFAVQGQDWRGMGRIEASGLGLSERYVTFDALRRFPMIVPGPERASDCISGEILRGVRKPCDCPAFARGCTPGHPLGATMVSSEGACAAYYRYRRTALEPTA